jgi:hypothetical protein
MMKAIVLFLLFLQVSLQAQTLPQDFTLPSEKAKLGDIHYGNKVGGIIGQWSIDKQLIFIEEGDQLMEVIFGLPPEKNIVGALKFKVQKKSGTIEEYIFGDPQKQLWQAPHKVKKGITIAGISGAGGWLIDNMRIHFSDGTATQLYGGKGGDNTFNISITKDKKGRAKGRFMGFWGSYVDKIESIGLVFFPIE